MPSEDAGLSTQANSSRESDSIRSRLRSALVRSSCATLFDMRSPGVKAVQRVDAVDGGGVHEQEPDRIAGALRLGERLLQPVDDRIAVFDCCRALRAGFELLRHVLRAVYRKNSLGSIGSLSLGSVRRMR